MNTTTRPNTILTLDRLRLAVSRNESAAKRSEDEAARSAAARSEGAAIWRSLSQP